VNVQAGQRRPGPIAAALARAEAWLLEPAEPAVAAAETGPGPTGSRPVVAVFGLALGCGATVVTRALAAELGARDGGAAAVACAAPAAAIPLASPAASRLARTLASLPGARARAVGRLCLVEGADQLALCDAARYLAPVVIDAGHAVVGGVPAALAHHAVLVASPRVEPALASVAAACLARVGPEPIVVVNRSRGDEGWSGPASVELPDARMGAQLALGGREPRGELGRAIADLADLCEEPR
jgi:hypothetical protein